MLLVKLLLPAVGGICVLANAPMGMYGDVDTPFAYPAGVEPSTRLSSMSICDRIRRLSLMWSSGLIRNRMFAPAWLLS
jgi:hypothetical protein